VVTYTQDAIETSAETVQETAIDLSGIIAQVETTGSVTKEQIQALSSKTTTLVLQTETLVKIVQVQTENIKTMQAQNETALLEQYDKVSWLTAEVKALTTERDRAIDKYEPWKKTALTLIFIFSILLLLTIIRYVLKYFVKT
jgi:hypothetical protein